jgi:hypothetical protein
LITRFTIVFIKARHWTLFKTKRKYSTTPSPTSLIYILIASSSRLGFQNNHSHYALPQMSGFLHACYTSSQTSSTWFNNRNNNTYSYKLWRYAFRNVFHVILLSLSDPDILLSSLCLNNNHDNIIGWARGGESFWARSSFENHRVLSPSFWMVLETAEIIREGSRMKRPAWKCGCKFSRTV